MVVDLTKSNDSNWEIAIDGKMVSKRQLVKAWRFYQEYQLIGGETECSLCGCDLQDNDKFCCRECCRILPLDEVCEQYDDICKDCYEENYTQSAYEEYVDCEIDKMRGK